MFDAKYKSLAELKAGVADLSTVVASVDNDQVLFYAGEERLLDLHPNDLILQSLELLGIKADFV